MIPLKDENPTRTVPLVTLVLIIACVAVYFMIQPGGQSTFVDADAESGPIEEMRFHLDHAAIPKELTSGRPLTEDEVATTFETPARLLCPAEEGPACWPDKNIWWAVVYSMFLHGSVMHLLGNMLFLWIFGNNIEERRGRVAYIVFYLSAGVVATAAHIMVDPAGTIPLVGASGAIAGVMGAYLVLYPGVRIHTLLIIGFFIMVRDISAKWLLLFWFVTQFFVAPNSGVANMAHIGGFVFGMAVGLVWRLTSRPERPKRLAYA